MDKVCYVLGAGFSAPLGIPVMNNFLMKSKDIYLTNPTLYRQFEYVFNRIKELSVIKNYYETELFNIEEILSILEMKQYLKNSRENKYFINYIKSVINFCTPPIEQRGLVSNWEDMLFGGPTIWEPFGYFLCNLFNLEIHEMHQYSGGESSRNFFIYNSEYRESLYSIVTLNYDLVLEKLCDFLTSNLQSKTNISFNREFSDDWSRPCIAKLHGSVDDDNMILPTWSKGKNPKVLKEWKNAFKILSSANHIRFVGYSLASADAYIKYLFKSSILESEHLKSIEVICRDEDGSVRERYDSFVNFKGYYRFYNDSIESYLTPLVKHSKKKYPINNSIKPEGRTGDFVRLNSLEKSHNEYANRARV
jgi:hypothetical protein